MARTDREIVEGYGRSADTTPVDTLMAGPDTMHHEVAWAMNNPDEEIDPNG